MRPIHVLTLFLVGAIAVQAIPRSQAPRPGDALPTMEEYVQSHMAKLSRGQASRAAGRRVPGAATAGGLDERVTARRVSAVGDAAPSWVNVADYGAVGDGKTDNTDAFQKAINSLTDGGIAFIPSGQFLFKGTVVMPIATTFEGTYRSVPSHNVGQGGLAPTDGSVLMPTFGRNNESAAPFLTVSEDCTLRGVVIYYPDVDPNALPVPYPYAIDMTGNNPAVIDVELLNPFNGIRAVGAGRHYIARVQGQPANVGIFVDQTYDIGRIEDVHWNPWFSGNHAYMYWQLTHGRAFEIARSDWEYVLNTFAFGYAIGYHFIKSTTGSCNGNFVGIGADLATNASVQVDSADPWGIMITSGEFTSFVGTWGTMKPDSTQVVVNPTNTGAVRFVNSAFWGPSNQIARHYSGTLGFGDCTFNYWDHQGKGEYAVQAYGGDLFVRGCDFQMNGNQVLASTGVQKTVLTGNIVVGSVRMDTSGAKNAQVGYNAYDA